MTDFHRTSPAEKITSSIYGKCLAGNTLLWLGYEHNQSWIKRCFKTFNGSPSWNQIHRSLLQAYGEFTHASGLLGWSRGGQTERGSRKKNMKILALWFLWDQRSEGVAPAEPPVTSPGFKYLEKNSRARQLKWDTYGRLWRTAWASEQLHLGIMPL